MQVVTKKSFTIENHKVINFMIENNITHIKFCLTKIEDNVFILVKYPDYKNQLTLGREWVKVIYGRKKIYTRNPSILIPYIGKHVEIYQEPVFMEGFELFRIKIMEVSTQQSLLLNSKKLRTSIPYFTKAGMLIIPKSFINEKFKDFIPGSKISFNRVHENLINKGFIFAYPVMHDDKNVRLTFKPSIYFNNLRLRVQKLFKVIVACGKTPWHFKYQAIVHDDDYGYDVIVFKEEDEA